jgi:hypothetical protein
MERMNVIVDSDPALVERFGSARECVAQGIYQRGLKRAAHDVGQKPGNLSAQLAGRPARHFSLDMFEMYVEKSGDLTPIYYLVEKFLGDKRNSKQAAVEQIQKLAPELIELLKKAGISK